MLEKAIIISLQITAIYILFSQGNLLSQIRVDFANFADKYFGKRNSIIIQKPLWSCLCCMSSLWTIALTLSIDIYLMLCVCGVNCIIYNLCFNDKADT